VSCICPHISVEQYDDSFYDVTPSDFQTYVKGVKLQSGDTAKIQQLPHHAKLKQSYHTVRAALSIALNGIIV